jgi:benzoate membrane transport protein
MLQPITLGLLAALVGFASSFTVVLAGLTAVGASAAEAASGLAVLCLAMGSLGVALSWRLRLPISIAWSTPGAALLVTSGVPEGGFPAAVGAFLLCAVLILLSGLFRPLARAVEAIPAPLAAAMLAGVLLDLCLAPVRAIAELPWLALPVVLAWAAMLRLARLWAVPAAVLVATLAMALGPGLPADAAPGWPALAFVWPVFELQALIGIGLPLFLVTMASQNLPGYAVLRAHGYAPPLGPIFAATGAMSLVAAPWGSLPVNLAAITAALCAGPEAHPDPSRRWVAAVVAGAGYMVLFGLAGAAAALVAAAPPVLIQAVAGLALLGALASALSNALATEAARLPAIATFLTAASGLSLFGIGAAFWGLLAGAALMALLRQTEK